MRKWWRSQQEETKDENPPAESPPPTDETSLPDPHEAREALAESRENKRRTEELGEEVKEMLAFMRAAREKNHFAEGLVEMIVRGR